MPVANKRIEYIRLKWSEKDRKMLLVEDADEERFCMAIDEAIDACKVHDRRKQTLFRRQFDALLAFLSDWSCERRDKLTKVLLTIRDAGLLFLLVTKRKSYDEELEDELTQLDLQVAHDKAFSEILLSVQALPLCDENSYDSFCNPERTLEYVGINVH